MMNKSTITTVLIIAVILSAGSFFTYKALNPGENASNSEAARSLSGEEGEQTFYTDLDGNPVDMSAYAGKVRVVNSWATWCPFCTKELADFEKLAETGGEEVVVIAINRGESAAKIKAYLSRLGQFDDLIFIKDESDHFYKTIGGFAMPETIFYDKAGQVYLHKRGFMELSEMQKHLEATINSVTE